MEGRESFLPQMTEIRSKTLILWKDGSQVLEWIFFWHVLRRSLPSHQLYSRGPYPGLSEGLKSADVGDCYLFMSLSVHIGDDYRSDVL